MKWAQLKPADSSAGFVLFGVSRCDTVVDVTRIAVLMSHFYKALPLAVHVAAGAEPTWEGNVDLEGERLFELARQAALELGYPLRTYSEFSVVTTQGIRQAAERVDPYALVLGHPFARRGAGFLRWANALSPAGQWPVVFARSIGSIPLDHILVFLNVAEDLIQLQPILSCLRLVCRYHARLYFLMPGGHYSEELDCSSIRLAKIAESVLPPERVSFQIVSGEAHADEILNAASSSDLVIAKADQQRPAGRIVLDLLAQDKTQLPCLIVLGDLRPKER